MPPLPSRPPVIICQAPGPLPEWSGTIDFGWGCQYNLNRPFEGNAKTLCIAQPYNWLAKMRQFTKTRLKTPVAPLFRFVLFVAGLAPGCRNPGAETNRAGTPTSEK